MWNICILQDTDKLIFIVGGLNNTFKNIEKIGNYIIDYSSDAKQAKWVVYELTSSEVKGDYGRGHLPPAGDMKFS